MTNLPPPIVAIEADSIADAYIQVLYNIHKKGTPHIPDYGIPTKRISALIHISNLFENQIHELCPLGEMTLEKYKKEMTSDYADWYMSLANDDKRKFEYCYAKQLFRYGKLAYDHLTENIKSMRVGSRRHVGVLWENEIHVPKYEDQPCWIAYKVELLENNNVVLYGTYRSWDAYGGLPANLPGIAYGVQKAIDDSGFDYKLTDMIFNGYDLHMYKPDYDNNMLKLCLYEPCAKCGKLEQKQKMMQRPKGLMCGRC